MPYDPKRHEFISFFRPQVLAQYREHPDRYEIRTDDNEGRVTLTTDYYTRLSDEQRRTESLEVIFGYRKPKSGDSCIAIFAYHLTKKSPGHVARWLPYLVENEDWVDSSLDERFLGWFRRYVEGDWGVDNGVASYVIEELKLLNGLTLEALGSPLFEVGDNPEVAFPAAENTWMYEQAHVSLYRLLVDGLSLHCIRALGVAVGRPLEKGTMRTLKALKRVLPQLEADDRFSSALETVSTQRGKASHHVRAAARPMNASETFLADLKSCLAALRLVTEALQHELGLDAKRSKERQDALKYLPKITAEPESNYSINRALFMEGKTVDRVEIGFRQTIAGLHQSEALIIHFNDGSIMGLDTGSNAGNFECEKHSPDDFHVDLNVHWVLPAK